MDSSPPAAVADKRYDAFLSYSHAVDDRFAPELQRGLQRFARPWRQRRALDVFRDRTGLSVDPDLWASIARALDSSDWFVYLASPAAAGSPWVGREIEHWKAEKDPSRILVVLTDGDWAWDEARGGFDQERSTAIHPALWDAFPGEPLVLDMRWAHRDERLTLRDARFRDAVAELAAPIHGRAKDDLEDEDTRALRRTRRIAGAGVSLLVVLLVLAVVAGVVAVRQAGEAGRQRDEARRQLVTSQARQLAATSGTMLGTDLGTANLLAAQAFAMHSDAQTRRALLDAVTASPALVGYLDARSTVTALAASRDGSAVAAGTQSGQVLVWRPGESLTPVEAHAFDDPVVAVAMDETGALVVASDGTEVWQTGSDRSTPAQTGWTVTALAATAAGPTTAQYEVPTDTETERPRLVVTSAGVPVVVPDSDNYLGPNSLTFDPDGSVVSFNYAGAWMVVTPAGGPRVTSRDEFTFGAHLQASAMAPDGRLLGYTNGSRTVPFYPTLPDADRDPPWYVGASSGQAPTSMAVSPDDGSLAVANAGSIDVSRLVEPDQDAEVLHTLTGNASVAPGLLTFLGGQDRLASATGSTVALWDTRRLGRIASTYPLDPPISCAACSGPVVRVSPDGESVAVVGEGGFGSLVQQVGSDTPLAADDDVTISHGLPVWTPDGRVLVPTTEQVEVRDAATWELIDTWTLDPSLSSVAADTLSEDGSGLVLVSDDGEVRTLDVATGSEMSSAQAAYPTTPQDRQPSVVLNADGSDVAVVTQDEVLLSSLDGATEQRLPLTDLAQPDLAGHRLAAAAEDGASVWSTRTGEVTWTSGDVGGILAGPYLSDDGGDLAYQRLDGTVVVVDLRTSAELARFGLRSSTEGARSGLALSPDGQSLYAVTEAFDREPGSLDVWSLTADDWVDAACTSAGRPLTADFLADLTSIDGLAPRACLAPSS